MSGSTKRKLSDMYREGVRSLSVPRLRKSRKNLFASLNLKITAIYSVAQHLIHEIATIKSELEPCQHLYDKVQKPYDPFMWLKEDWRAQYQLHLIWLEILQAQSTERCLEKQKIRTDCDELMKCIVAILEPFLQRSTKRNIYIDYFKRRIQKALIYNYQFVNEKLLKQQKRMICKRKKLIVKNNAFGFISFVMCKAKDHAKRRILARLTVDKATKRYIKNYSEVRAEQVLIDRRFKLEKLKKEIAGYNRRIAEEKYVLQCTLDMYFTTIETLRQRYMTIHHNYESELRRLCDSVHSIKIKMKKHKDIHMFMVEQLARYRAELQHPGSADFENIFKEKLRDISRISVRKGSKGRRKMSKRRMTVAVKSPRKTKVFNSRCTVATITALSSSDSDSSELDLNKLKASFDRKIQNKSI